MLLIVFLGSAALLWAIQDANPGRDSAGSLTESGPLWVNDLRVGDCLNMPEGTDDVSGVTVRPCAKPHDAQVYAVGEVPEGEYPGDEAIQERVEHRCGERFEAVLGELPEADDLEITSLSPTLQGWPAYRGFSCLVHRNDGDRLVGDLTGKSSERALRGLTS